MKIYTKLSTLPVIMLLFTFSHANASKNTITCYVPKVCDQMTAVKIDRSSDRHKVLLSCLDKKGKDIKYKAPVFSNGQKIVVLKSFEIQPDYYFECE